MATFKINQLIHSLLQIITRASEQMSIKLNLKDAVLSTENGEIVTIMQEQSAIVQEFALENVNFSKSDPNNVSVDEANDEEDRKKLVEWLNDHGLSKVLVYLQSNVDAQVTFESLQYLEKDDIKEAIPPIGLRAKFRSKLSEWRKKEFDIECEEDSLRSDIRTWVKESSLNSSSPAPSPLQDIPNMHLL